MSITLGLAAGKGLVGNLVFGTLLGGALGFCAGKMSKSNSSTARRLARHIDRFGKELSSDPELSIDLFGKTDESFNNNNYIDYKTSRKNFLASQNDYNLDDIDYEPIPQYRNYNGYRQNGSNCSYYKNSYSINDERRNDDFSRTNYDIDNYTRRYNNYENKNN